MATEPTEAEPTESPVTTAVKRGRRPSPRIAQWKRTWYFLRRNTLALIGLGVIFLLVAVAIYAATLPLQWTQMQQYCAYTPNSSVLTCPSVLPQVCVYYSGTAPPAPNCYVTPGPTASSSAGYPALIPPTVDWGHFRSGPLPFGSFQTPDQPTGSNLFYNMEDGLLRGADWSLMLSVSIVGLGALIGLMVGAISGYFGGITDEVLMRLVDIMLSIPQLLFVLITVAVLTQLPFFANSFSIQILFLVLAFVIVWWPLYARIVRGQVLVTREQKFVEAARASGASGGRIVRKHIIPNAVYPVFVQMSLDVGSIPLLIGGLIFLGFSQIFPHQTFPEWGTLSALSVSPSTLQNLLVSCQLGACAPFPWWMILFPGFALFIYAISVNFLSDGLRDALDPRLRR